ncbi:MAG: hypothetical protein AB8G17_16520 [Gammaproteobacteria bacterium]
MTFSFSRCAVSTLLSACLWLPAHIVGAAEQGTTDTTSTGSVDVTLTTGLSARLSGLSDMALGTWSGTGDLSANQNLCVGRTGVGFFANGSYRIRASGDGDASDVHAFTLSNGAQSVYYDVFFNDQTGLVGRTPLTGGVMLSAQQGFGLWEIFNVVFGCTVRNANLSINVPEAQLAAASGGVYSGTLTLVLIPD